MSKLVRLLTISLTMIALVGQGFALGVSECDMDHEMNMSSAQDSTPKTNMSADNPMHHDHQQMDHGGHQMAMSQQDSSQVEVTTMAMDCCDIQCSCPANACSSSSFLHFASVVEIPRFASISLYLTNRSNIQKRQNSLYRPPILA